MTCKDCAKFTECESLATHDIDHSHRMWLTEFWDNAEERCRAFEKNNECGEKKQTVGENK